MAVRSLEITGKHSSPEDFKSYVLITALKDEHVIRFTAAEVSDNPNTRGSSANEEFEGSITNLHPKDPIRPDDDDFTVAITETRTGRWILIVVKEDRVYFDLTD